MYAYEFDLYDYIGSHEQMSDIKCEVDSKLEEYERKYQELWQSTQ